MCIKSISIFRKLYNNRVDNYNVYLNKKKTILNKFIYRGFVKKNELFPYLINKDEFNTKKNMARLRYRESILEIEEALAGNDIELVSFFFYL